MFYSDSSPTYFSTPPECMSSSHPVLVLDHRREFATWFLALTQIRNRPWLLYLWPGTVTHPTTVKMPLMVDP